MAAPNRIPEEEYLKRIETFFEIHKTEFMRIEANQITEMFILHNDRLTPNETGRSCSTCRGRVYRRLLAHYESIKNNTQQ